LSPEKYLGAMAEPAEEVKLRPIHIVKANMPEEMQESARKKINEALDSMTVEKDIATAVKKHFDEHFKPTWHCIVGKNFGCSITHDTHYLIFFKVEQHHVLLFKSLE
jgi:dynein light chain LC8-type